MSNDAAAKEKPKKSKTTLLLILVAVLALAGTTVSLYTLFNNSGNAAPSAPAAVAEGPYLIYGPQDFTVNLSNGDQRRYLKANIALGYSDKKLTKELEKRREQLRNEIIEVLRSRSVEDMSDVEGTQMLRVELIDSLNTILSSGQIVEIYFTDLLVQ